jgi:hypothetical protein
MIKKLIGKLKHYVYTLLCVVIFLLYCLLKMMEGTREVIDNDW